MASWDDSPIKKKKSRKKHPENKHCFIHIIENNVETVSSNVSWKVPFTDFTILILKKKS